MNTTTIDTTTVSDSCLNSASAAFRADSLVAGMASFGAESLLVCMMTQWRLLTDAQPLTTIPKRRQELKRERYQCALIVDRCARLTLALRIFTLLTRCIAHPLHSAATNHPDACTPGRVAARWPALAGHGMAPRDMETAPRDTANYQHACLNRQPRWLPSFSCSPGRPMGQPAGYNPEITL
jgi:hypothetical protein